MVTIMAINGTNNNLRMTALAVWIGALTVWDGRRIPKAPLARQQTSIEPAQSMGFRAHCGCNASRRNAAPGRNRNSI
jgi:hypothetical protein